MGASGSSQPDYKTADPGGKVPDAKMAIFALAGMSSFVQRYRRQRAAQFEERARPRQAELAEIIAEQYASFFLAMQCTREDVELMLHNGPGPDPVIADALQEVFDSVTLCSEAFVRHLPGKVVSKFWLREE